MGSAKVGPYTIETDDAGAVVRRILLDETQVIEPDPENQHFCDCLTELSIDRTGCGQLGEAAPRFPISGRHFFFCDLEKFIEYCKRTGFTLFAEKLATRDHWGLGQGNTFRFPKDNTPFRNVQQAVADYQENEDMPDGLIEASTSSVWASPDLLSTLQANLRSPDEEPSVIRRLSSWPASRAFVYLDVSDFSKHKSGQQRLIIGSLIKALHGPIDLFGRLRDGIGKFEELCIGDGYIYVFTSPLKAVLFAAVFATLLERGVAEGAVTNRLALPQTSNAPETIPVEFHFRIGVHVGPVYSFWDYGRNSWNYIGQGINGGQRVLAAIGKETDDVIFISGQTRNAIVAFMNHSSGLLSGPEERLLSCLQNRGRHADKHGNLWRVYEVNHVQYCHEHLRI